MLQGQARPAVDLADELVGRLGRVDVVVVAILVDCPLYTSDAADERSSVDLGCRRIVKKKKTKTIAESLNTITE